MPLSVITEKLTPRANSKVGRGRGVGILMVGGGCVKSSHACHMYTPANQELLTHCAEILKKSDTRLFDFAVKRNITSICSRTSMVLPCHGHVP